MASSRSLDRATSRKLMQRLNRDAAFLARPFNLQYKSIEAERANVKNRFGVCYSDGMIKIRLCHSVSGKPLKYSSLVSTLCHELAHLRHFNHGLRFRAFNQRILEFARTQGIYRPAPRGSRALSSSLPTLHPAATTRRRSAPREPVCEPASKRPEPVQLALFG